MKNFKYKRANFWRRITARLIDLSIVLITSILLSWLFLDKKIEGQELKIFFIKNELFYIYVLIIIFLLIFLNIVLPIIWKGKTIGLFLMRIKIVAEKNLKLSIIKREIFWSWSWVFCSLLTMIIINHTLIIKLATTTKNIKLTMWENLRITFVSTVASIIIFIQMILAISIIIRKNQGIHDTLSKTKIVYIKKFITDSNSKKNNNRNDKFLEPTKLKKEQINFIE